MTTEKDVQKGNNRLPLNLARLYEEDLMSDDEVQNAKLNNLKISPSDLNNSNLSIGNRGGAIFNQDDILKNIEHR